MQNKEKKKDVTRLVEVHEMIRIVIQDQEVVFAGYPVNLLPPFQRDNNACGIRSGGVYVHYFWHFLARQFPVPQRFPENLWNHTMLILRDRDQLHLMRRDL